MIRKFFFVAIAAAAVALASPASALTIDEARDAMAGYSCYDQCTKSETVTTITENPDIITNTVEPIYTTVDGTYDPFSTAEGCWTTTMNGKTIRATNVNSDCVAQSIAPTSGSSTSGTRIVTTVTDGGTTTTVTCETTIATMEYIGPTFETGWDVTISSGGSSSGPCN